ncbi:MAG: eukaryotic-like serine/threonine-protein kinase [Thermoanaerobaculia bacterium]|jgi:serine/threonine protein kinase|nr:eukaryotic-like serine/threonine-protein kinase [Thermoanaerobaculia bacterium]
MTLPRGARLGPYEIEELIGRGGMGEVYRASDTRLGRDVAIKVLSSHLAGDPASLGRFRREARAIAALSHPNIVAVFDVGSEGDTQFVVTELLEGETLRAKLAAPLPGDETLRIAIAIADGLAAAHAKGIIHRDLKPENVFLTSAGGVKILDFGLASMQQSANTADSIVQTAALTEPGLLMGTIGYTSPEQLAAKPLTPATDVFSFGCVLFEMLQGQMPFKRDSNMEVIASILRDEPVTRDAAKPLPPHMRSVVERCLEKNPLWRFQNGGEVADALHGLKTSAPVRRLARRRFSPLLIVLLVVILGLAAVVSVFIARGDEVIDNGYDLRRSDITGDSETRRLTALALHADGAGNRSEAIQLLTEAVRRDPNPPLPVAFLASFSYYSGDRKSGARWSAETKRRLPNATSPYEALLCRYLQPVNGASTEMALASSLLELRPRAWRLRLALAHLHLSRRESKAALAQLTQIDVSAPDDRRLSNVLADRASLGDIAGATRDLSRSKLTKLPTLLAFTQARIAWSSGHAAEAARLFDSAAESATIANFGPVAIDARMLAGIARIGMNDLDQAQTTLDLAAASAHDAGLTQSELESYAFGAYVAGRRGDAEGLARRFRLAAALAEPGSNDYTILHMFAARERITATFGTSAVAPDIEITQPVLTLINARDAWSQKDFANASRLLQQSRSEGIDATWFREEAALLAYDLGEPPRSFRPDPPYPNRLRFIAVWELTRPRRQSAPLP